MVQERLENRAAKVSFVTGVSTLLVVVFQVISVPICLKYWGKEAYGSWLSLFAAFVLVRSMDAGFISYVGNKLNYLYHQNQSALREHMASSITGIAVIGMIQLSIGILAIFSDAIFLFLDISSEQMPDYHSNFALLVLIGSWVLSGAYLGIVHRLLIPTGLMYQAAWWSMGFQASQFAAIILAAMLQFDLFQISLLYAFIQFSIYLSSAVYIRLKLPSYYPWWQGFRFAIGIKDLIRSMLLTVSNFIQQGSISGVVILISALSGPAFVPVFTTVRTLVNLWTNITNVLTNPLLPDVVRYYAKNEIHKLITINQAYWVLVGSIVNFGVLITYPIIEPLYSYWTIDEVALDKSLLCLLLGSIVLSNIGGLISLYFNGINSLGILMVVSVIRFTLSLVVGSFLFLYIGLAGFGMGIMIGELLVLLVFIYYFFKSALHGQKVELSLFSLAPITVSTVSVLIFLINEGYGFIYMHEFLYPAALFGVVFSAVWGWKRLTTDIKKRLSYMVINRLKGKGIA